MRGFLMGRKTIQSVTDFAIECYERGKSQINGGAYQFSVFSSQNLSSLFVSFARR
jgi:hypothetical protein